MASYLLKVVLFRVLIVPLPIGENIKDSRSGFPTNSQSIYCSLCLLNIFGGKNQGQPNPEDGEPLLEVDCNSGSTSMLND